MLDSPRDKILWDVGHQAYPAQGPHRQARPPSDDPAVRGAGSILLPRGVRARHHGRRPRLHGGKLRRRHQGGDAKARPAWRGGDRRAGAGPRGGRGRRRRDDRWSGVRSAPQRGRPPDSDRDRPERQRHVDLTERWRAVALLQPDPPRPEGLPRARGARDGADEASGRDRQAHRAPGAAVEGVSQGLLGARPLLRGARPRLRRRHRRARRQGASRGARPGAQSRSSGGGSHQDGQGQGLRSRGGWRARGNGEVARRQARIDQEIGSRRLRRRSRG